jgi:hypothetical protein
MLCGWTAFLFFIFPEAGWCNRPPGDFSLVSPADGAADVSVPLVLDWEDTTDPDGHAVTYTVSISENEDLSGAIVKENIRHSTLLVTAEDGLLEDTRYYWKVQAIDELGSATETEVWSFLPSINPTDVVVEGFVFDSGTGLPIPGATLLYGTKVLTAGADGFYQGSVSFTPGYTVAVNAECYIAATHTIEGVEEGDRVKEDFDLSPDPTGNVDGQDCVTLADAVIALRILSGVDTPGTAVNLAADVDGDGDIGLAEAIFALGVAAGVW